MIFLLASTSQQNILSTKISLDPIELFDAGNSTQFNTEETARHGDLKQALLNESKEAKRLVDARKAIKENAVVHDSTKIAQLTALLERHAKLMCLIAERDPDSAILPATTDFEHNILSPTSPVPLHERMELHFRINKHYYPHTKEDEHSKAIRQSANLAGTLNDLFPLIIAAQEEKITGYFDAKLNEHCEALVLLHRRIS